MGVDYMYKYLRNARIKKGLSQKQLGEECGLTQQAINRIEQGQRKIDVELLMKMSKALEVRIPEVMDLHFFSEQYDKGQAFVYEAKQDFAVYANEKVLIGNFRNLNTKGKGEAIKRVSELAQIPEYQKDKE